MKKLLVAACMAGIGWGVFEARADLMYVEGGTPTALAAYGDSGISFQVNETIEVTSLGFYGLSLGGGDTPWTQLWNDDTDTQLALVNWSAGEASGGWNDKDLVTPVTLVPGVTYQIQSTAYWINEYPDDSAFVYGASIDDSSVVFYTDGGFGSWGVKGTPSTGAENGAPAMTRFTYTVVPEPSTATLAFLGLCGAMAHRRLRARAA